MVLPQFLYELIAERECTIVSDNAVRPAISLSEAAPPLLLKRITSRRKRQSSHSSLSRWEMTRVCHSAPKSPGRLRRRMRSPSPNSNRTSGVLRHSETNHVMHRMNSSLPDIRAIDLNSRSRRARTQSRRLSLVDTGRSSLPSYLEPQGIPMNQSNFSLHSSHSSSCRWSSKSSANLLEDAPRSLVRVSSSPRDNVSRHMSWDDLSGIARREPPKKPVRRQSFERDDDDDKSHHTADLLAHALRITSSDEQS